MQGDTARTGRLWNPIRIRSPALADIRPSWKPRRTFMRRIAAGKPVWRPWRPVHLGQLVHWKKSEGTIVESRWVLLRVAAMQASTCWVDVRSEACRACLEQSSNFLVGARACTNGKTLAHASAPCFCVLPSADLVFGDLTAFGL